MCACLVAHRLILTASLLRLSEIVAYPEVCVRQSVTTPPADCTRAFVCICMSQVMQAHRVHNLVFSSSATVYGDPQYLPIDEQHPVGGCTNPYGKTKYFIEEIITDHCKAEKVGKKKKKPASL